MIAQLLPRFSFPDRIAVIVPVHHDQTRSKSARTDRATLLRRCLASLLDASKYCQYSTVRFREITIIPVDDYSSVDLISLVNLDMPGPITWLKNRGTKGQAGALNFAISTIDVDAFAFTDSDCVVALDWLKCIAEHYRAYPHHVGVGGPNWLFNDAPSWWSRVLTYNEGGLMRFLSESQINRLDATTTRIDFRNLSLRADFVRRVTAAGPLFIDGTVGVSCQASYIINNIMKNVGTPIGFRENMITSHQPVSSMRRQIATYYRRGCHSTFAEIYSELYGNLLKALMKRYIVRHFLSPLSYATFWYVWPLHLGFWSGIICRSLRLHATRLDSFPLRKPRSKRR
jgi:Glycosyl transferase family 2